MVDQIFDPTVPFRSVIMEREYQRARVVEVTDGDTVRLLLDLGHDPVTVTKSIRVADLFSPERRQGTPEERARGARAWDAARQLLREGATVYLRTEKVASGADRQTLGRIVGHVWFRDAGDVWQDFAATMRALGHDTRAARG
ncbi:MAG: thermonuclease family protein [Gemmatirosa sp.]